MVLSKTDSSYFPDECFDCKSVYGCLDCDSCKYCMYSLGEEDNYKPIDSYEITKDDVIMSDTDKIQYLKPNTVEITIPEGVESIVINFKKAEKKHV